MVFKKKTKSVTPEQAKKQAAQDWLPFEDVSSFIYKRNNELVIVLKVEPLNITLKSESEKKRIITAVHEALNGQMEALQIFCLPRSVDLDSYLEKLQEQARVTINLRQKRLLQDYINYVAMVVRGGEALEHRYYVLLSQRAGKAAKEELKARAYELASSLSKSGLEIAICDDMALLDMLFSFLQPSQASFEPTPLGIGYTTLFKEG